MAHPLSESDWTALGKQIELIYEFHKKLMESFDARK